jgi:GIY-YIG catalytic domain.
VVYKVKCKDCDKIYIGETKFKMKKRIDQHKKG